MYEREKRESLEIVRLYKNLYDGVSKVFPENSFLVFFQGVLNSIKPFSIASLINSLLLYKKLTQPPRVFDDDAYKLRGVTIDPVPIDGIIPEVPDLDEDYEETITKELDEEVQAKGLDALAFYIPFHTDLIKWGIYIKEDGLNYLARKLVLFEKSIKRTKGGVDIRFQAYNGAYQLLVDHELFHFIDELGISRFELARTIPIYLPYIDATKPYSETAEALANAYAFGRLPNAWLKKATENFMKSQPRGYREFAKYLSDLRDGIQQHLTKVLPKESIRGDEATSYPLDRRSLRKFYVPIQLLRSTRARDFLSLIIAIKSLSSSRKFEKSLERLPQHLREKWIREIQPSIRKKLRQRNVKFEKCVGLKFYSIRISKGFRVILEHNGGADFTLIDVGPHDIYRKYCH